MPPRPRCSERRRSNSPSLIARIAPRRGLHRRRHFHRIRHSRFPLARRHLDQDDAGAVPGLYRRSRSAARVLAAALRDGRNLERRSSPMTATSAVAELVARGMVSHVITQNIDALHQACGVPDDQVIELHGNTRHAKCLDCGARRRDRRHPRPFRRAWRCAGLRGSAAASSRPRPSPSARPCRKAKWRGPRPPAWPADLFLVLGSSLAVYPAAAFPLLAKRNGARLAILNREATEQDPYADLVIHARNRAHFAGGR